ncbi:hypothetical protein DT250_04260 [Bacillus sp. AR2-1]|uniref:hypothetical protein n=1 Tax=Bacillus sp. AR2-1 TaxID=2217816 RepID=UPI0011ED8783|nr:hypothetical protein [Bacillus sp. AR2-1]KAA0776194.1 hypothetical protein DT250_04260 [Bacillus sp. AR2-1]
MANITGPTPWAIILCKFSDQNQEPQNPQFFQDLFVNPSTGGMFDYWHDISYGAIDLTYSKVFGWLQLPYTLATDKQRTRMQRITSAIDAVKNQVDFSPFYGIIVILNAQVDSGSVGIQQLTFGSTIKNYGLLVLDPGAWNNTFAAHEMGHGYGLDHSFDTNPVSYDPNDDSRPGAYGDKWDIMSAFTFAGCSATFQDPRFGASGPGLNALNHLVLGWATNQITDVDLNLNNWRERVNLSPLNQPVSSGSSAFVRVLYGSSTYTVEYRKKAGWDRGIIHEAVLVHKLQNGSSYLQEGKYTQDLQEGDVFLDVGVTIKVETINSIQGYATVTIGPPNSPSNPPHPSVCDNLRRMMDANSKDFKELSRRRQNTTCDTEKIELDRKIEENQKDFDVLFDEWENSGCP